MPNPSYSLQHRNSTDTAWVACGTIKVKGNSDVHFIAQGQSGDGTKIHGAKYTAKANGGGTYSDPVAGDALSLDGYNVTVGGTQYSFSGDATYQTASGTNPAGYKTGGTIIGSAGDWEATNTSPEP